MDHPCFLIRNEPQNISNKRVAHINSTGQHQMGQVHEHCVCLLQLSCSCGCCGRHTNNMIFNQNEQLNISIERVAEDNTRWVRCTSIHIEYKNIVFASYHFSVPLVVEWYTFRCCGRYTNNMIFDQKWTIKYLRWKSLRWKSYSGQHQMGWVHYHPQSVLEHQNIVFDYYHFSVLLEH